MRQPVRHGREGDPARDAVAVRDRDGGVAATGQPGRLGHEPARADAGLADHEGGAHRARGGAVQCHLERAQLGPAAHQAHRRPGCRRRRGGCRGGHPRGAPRDRRRLDEVRDQPPGGGVGLDAELLQQQAGAVVERAHRPRAVAAGGLQPDQLAVALLVERGQLDPAPGRPQRDVPVPGAARGVGDERAELPARLGELLAAAERPVVVEARQQLTPVRRQRRGAPAPSTRSRSSGAEQGRLPGPVEVAQVDPAGRAVAPGQVPWRDHHRLVVAQQHPQVVQLAAQVGQRLRLGGVRPEGAGDPRVAAGCPRGTRAARSAASPWRRCGLPAARRAAWRPSSAASLAVPGDRRQVFAGTLPRLGA